MSGIVREASARTATRQARSRDFAALVAGLKAANYRPPKASLLFALLREAKLSLDNAASGRLARQQFSRENPQAELPQELADTTLAQYYLDAARCFANAALVNARRKDWNRAFRHFRKAAVCYTATAHLQSEAQAENLAKAQECRERAAAIRQKLARQNIFWRRLGLGRARR